MYTVPRWSVAAITHPSLFSKGVVMILVKCPRHATTSAAIGPWLLPLLLSMPVLASRDTFAAAADAAGWSAQLHGPVALLPMLLLLPWVQTLRLPRLDRGSSER
jgi:hypothetical protein